MPDPNTSPKPAQHSAPSAPEPKAEEAPKVRLLEVELQYKYCPHDLVQPDGTVKPNGDPNTGIMQTIPPGVHKLSAKDANIALRSRIAIPTVNTEF